MHLTGALSVDPLLGLLSVTMGRLGRGVKVLRLVTLGKSNSEIAEELVISLNTVACHVSRILNKTNPAIPTFDTSSRLSIGVGRVLGLVRDQDDFKRGIQNVEAHGPAANNAVSVGNRNKSSSTSSPMPGPRASSPTTHGWVTTRCSSRSPVKRASPRPGVALLCRR